MVRIVMSYKQKVHVKEFCYPLFLLLFITPFSAYASPDEPIRWGDDVRVAPGSVARNVSLPSGDNRIDSLLSTFKWPNGVITYSFYDDEVFAGSYYGYQAGVREVSEEIKNNVRAIVAHINTSLNITLNEVVESSTTVGQIRFMLSNDPQYSYAYYPTSAAMFHLSGDVHLNTNFDVEDTTNGFRNGPGKHGYMSLIHEIGHALGLKHPHDSAITLPSSQDNTSFSLMSYNFFGSSSVNYMLYDTLALEYLYGEKNVRTGDTNYSFNVSIDEPQVDGVSIIASGSTNSKLLIKDSGGTNVVNLSNIPTVPGGYYININQGGWIIPLSAHMGNYFSFGSIIGAGTQIHNVINSPYSDVIVANTNNNIFSGYEAGQPVGDDTLYNTSLLDMLDFSTYLSSEVSQTVSLNDRIFLLGVNGSVTIKDYEIGKAPSVVFRDGVFIAPTPTPTPSVLPTAPPLSTATLSPVPTFTPTNIPTATTTLNSTPTPVPEQTFIAAPATKVVDLGNVLFYSNGGKIKNTGSLQVGAEGTSITFLGQMVSSIVLPFKSTEGNNLVSFKIRIKGKSSYVGVALGGRVYNQSDAFYRLAGTQSELDAQSFKLTVPENESWNEVILPIDKYIVDNTIHISFINNALSNYFSSVDIADVVLFSDTTTPVFEFGQVIAVEDNETEEKDVSCSIRTKCRTIARRSHCRIESILESSEGSIPFGLCESGIKTQKSTWVALKSGTANNAGISSRRVTLPRISNKNRVFVATSFPEYTCKVFQEIQ
jgi:hypothetical protein